MKGIEIKNTTYTEIKKLRKGHEGLVFMGCGGTAERWLIDVTKDMVKEHVLPTGTKPADIWQSVYVFLAEDDSTRTDMLFIWKDTPLINYNKLPIWRINLGFARWLSDYIQ